MKKLALPPPDFAELENKLKVESIDKDFILLDDISQVPFFDYPVKMDTTTAIICHRGKLEAGINLQRYTLQAPCIVVLQHGHISQYFHASDDFGGYFIVLSKRFLDGIEMDVRRAIPLGIYLYNNPSTPISDEELALLTEYYEILRKAVNMQHNPHRLELAQHLIQAFFYNADYIFQRHFTSGNGKQSRQDIIFAGFMNYVQQYYKEQRSLTFYADKLCLTSKHLSAVIKTISGKSANDWIDEHVILEAKALLKSTNMTIQQISDELHFPSQSFFSRYFKNHTGMAPKDYKRG